ncbi:hypothetical protein FRACA_210035 [Frankia canadensis]|uniref:Uncharacterized protein n=1 Tax=Frankia canadensis TaxID=1836972 RepID=A0A2I2KQM5_9ACTN|nr:hypothetical protein FRACA_210035 [Frankia canadensis]SOU55240.1 hypothetical protein FRACA_210035 [Frankia canadensis]
MRQNVGSLRFAADVIDSTADPGCQV